MPLLLVGLAVGAGVTWVASDTTSRVATLAAVGVGVYLLWNSRK